MKEVVFPLSEVYRLAGRPSTMGLSCDYAVMPVAATALVRMCSRPYSPLAIQDAN